MFMLWTLELLILQKYTFLGVNVKFSNTRQREYFLVTFIANRENHLFGLTILTFVPIYLHNAMYRQGLGHQFKCSLECTQ